MTQVITQEQREEVKVRVNYSKFDNFLIELKKIADHDDPTFYKKWLLDDLTYGRASLVSTIKMTERLWIKLELEMLANCISTGRTDADIRRTFSKFKKIVKEIEGEKKEQRQRIAQNKQYTKCPKTGGIMYTNHNTSEETLVGLIEMAVQNIYRTDDGEIHYKVYLKCVKTDKTGHVRISAEDMVQPQKVLSAIMRKIPSAEVYIGMSKHLRPAIISTVPNEMDERRLLSKTGWVMTENGKMFSIKGLVPKGCDIDLETAYKYEISQIGDEAQDKKYLRALIESKDPKKTLPIICSMFFSTVRNVLPNPDRFPKFVMAIIGQTNNNKTLWSKMAMRMFIAPHNMGEDNLVGWGHEKATTNKLMEYFAMSSDLPFLLDNYIPSTEPGEKGLRNIINSVVEGRTKMRMKNATTGKEEEKPLNSFMLITGEDFISNWPSAIARTIPVNFEKGGKTINPHLEYLQKAKKPNHIGFLWLKWLMMKEGKKAINNVYDNATLHNEIENWVDKINTINTGYELKTVRRVAANFTAIEMVYELLVAHPVFGEVFSEYHSEFNEGMMGIAKNLISVTKDASESGRFISGFEFLLNKGCKIIDCQLSSDEVIMMHGHNNNPVIGWYKRNRVSDNEYEYQMYIKVKDLIPIMKKAGYPVTAGMTKGAVLKELKQDGIYIKSHTVSINGVSQSVNIVDHEKLGIPKDYFDKLRRLK